MILNSSLVAAAYRTALGRTMCEIKSKRHDEHEDDLRRALFTVNGYGKHDSSGQCVRSQGLNSNSASHEVCDILTSGIFHFCNGVQCLLSENFDLARKYNCIYKHTDYAKILFYGGKK